MTGLVNVRGTSFARFGAQAARRTLVATLLLAIGLVTLTRSVYRSPSAGSVPQHGDAVASQRAGDLALHQATLARTVQGERYYDAVGVELRQRRYPTRSVFNWRTPLPVWLIARLPGLAWARAALAAIAISVMILASVLLARESGFPSAGWGACVLVSGLLPCLLDNLYVMSEIWSGALIALSVVCYGVRWTSAGQLTALLALLFRELAAPYYVVCVALAVWERRWRDVRRLGLGLAVYAAFYAMHVREVLARIHAGDAAHEASWVAFGGIPFVLATVQMNGVLLLLPQSVAAVYFVAAGVGFAGWTSPAGLRAGLTAAAYVVGFAVVGQPFNRYWGSLVAPLFCLGVARFPLSLRDLWRRAPAVTPG